MLKVTKFGGSSMADAGQYRKVRDIVLADPARKVVVVSAAGKRFSQDHKITDLLYLCHAHTQYGVDCDRIFDMITSRYLEIRDDLRLIRRIAMEEYGMVGEEYVRMQYLTLTNEDLIEVYEEEKEQAMELSALLSAIGVK